MKANRTKQPEKFIPVNLILETQAEVDGIYTLLNQPQIRGSVGFSEGTYAVLELYKDNQNSLNLYRELIKVLK